MKKYLLLLLACSLVITTQAQQKPAFVIYNAKGKKVSYRKMLKTSREANLVFFGELHDNPIAHWLELELTKDLSAKKNLIMGAEMFERDNDAQLQDYLAKRITKKQLDSSARLWNNYKTDYAPLVDYARDHNIPFVATNVPRRYASLVSRGGLHALDTLSAAEKKWIAPLPILYDSLLPGYQKMLEMMPGHTNAGFFPQAQAIKDATMAHYILENYKPQSLFLHFNGSYHSQNNEGILWYIRQQRPDLIYCSIATVSQANVLKLDQENKGKADFIICVDEDMTSTF